MPFPKLVHRYDKLFIYKKHERNHGPQGCSTEHYAFCIDKETLTPGHLSYVHVRTISGVPHPRETMKKFNRKTAKNIVEDGTASPIPNLTSTAVSVVLNVNVDRV